MEIKVSHVLSNEQKPRKTVFFSFWINLQNGTAMIEMRFSKHILWIKANLNKTIEVLRQNMRHLYMNQNNSHISWFWHFFFTGHPCSCSGRQSFQGNSSKWQRQQHDPDWCQRPEPPSKLDTKRVRWDQKRRAAWTTPRNGFSLYLWYFALRQVIYLSKGKLQEVFHFCKLFPSEFPLCHCVFLHFNVGGCGHMSAQSISKMAHRESRLTPWLLGWSKPGVGSDMQWR